MIEIHIDADDADIYVNVDNEDMKLRQSFIVEAMTNALALLNETNTKAVIFVVAKDLEQNVKYQILLKQFLNDGHAIGNHSYSHSESFHRWNREPQTRDIELAHKVISETLNYKSIYFRGPGYSSSHAIQESLLKMGYLYDCTKIPLVYSTVLDLYFKINKNRNKSFPNILRLSDLYFSLANPIPGIKELPIHPKKIWGIPIYSTWIFQNKNRRQYFLKLIEKTQRPFLFHAIDFLDYSSNKSKIPALRIESIERFEVIRKIFIGLKSRDKSIIE